MAASNFFLIAADRQVFVARKKKETSPIGSHEKEEEPFLKKYTAKPPSPPKKNI